MTEYTPTTDEIRERAAWDPFDDRHDPGWVAEFDRWLSQLLAGVWDEGFTAAMNYDAGDWEQPPEEYPNPYREEN